MTLWPKTNVIVFLKLPLNGKICFKWYYFSWIIHSFVNTNINIYFKTLWSIVWILAFLPNYQTSHLCNPPIFHRSKLSYIFTEQKWCCLHCREHKINILVFTLSYHHYGIVFKEALYFVWKIVGWGKGWTVNIWYGKQNLRFSNKLIFLEMLNYNTETELMRSSTLF